MNILKRSYRIPTSLPLSTFRRTHFVLLLLLLGLRPFAQPGAIDATFNPGTGANNRVSSVAVQSDGKILIGGDFTNYNNTSRNRIARLNADGTLDTTFNPGTGANNRVSSVAVQSDGKILIGGNFTTYNGTARNRIDRLNAAGTLDTSFNPGTGANLRVYSVAVQSDGKILIGGDFTTYNTTSSRNRIARLNADGTLDTTFAPGTGANFKVNSVAVQSDGKILIGGDFTSYNGTTRNYIARLNAAGTLDTTFDPGTGANASVFSVAVQSDGKILIGGNFLTYNGTGRNRIARVNADGTLDTTFVPGTGASATINSVAVQSDGKILIGGDFTTYNGTARSRIARLNADGTLDTTFVPGGGTGATINSVAVQSDGKILIGGAFTSYNGTTRYRVARLLISCTNPTSGGTIAAAQSGNSPFDPAAFTSSAAASGQSGTLEYNWQSSNTSSSAGFNDIASSNSATYNAGALTQTTWYKRLARVSCAADWSGAVESNVLEVMVGVTWNGSLSTNWSTAANWTPNAVPAVGQLVVIPTGLTNYPAVPSDRTISSLSLASGASLNLNSNTLTLASGLSNAGSITGAGKLTMGGSSAQSISGTGTVSNLEVNNSTGVTITSGAGNMQSITGVLTPTAGTLTTNGNLTLKSSASGTARVAAVPASGAAITGNVTVERYLPLGRKWRMLTAPLTGSSNNSIFYNWQNNDLPNGNTGVEIWGTGGVADPSSSNVGLALGGGSSMRSYGSSGWADVTNTNTSLLFDNTTNYGYALFATGPYNNGSTTYIGGPGSLPAAAATTLSATGTLITGDHTKNLSAAAANQFFLVGNPYASPVDPRSFTETPTANRTNLNGKLWMWDAKPGVGTGSGLGRYVSFDLNSNLYNVTGNGYADNNVMIQSGQAFFVQATASGAATLVFRETSKNANGSHEMMGDEIRTAKALLRLTLQQPVTADSADNLDGAVAVFHAEGKAGLDPLDGSKLMNSSENIFFRREDRSLTFEHRPVVTAKDTLYLRMSNLQNRTYRLQIRATDFPDADVVTAELTDRFTGKSTPISLKGDTDHAFAVTADSMSKGDRFMVVFSKAAAPVVVTPDTDADAAGLKLYPNPVRNNLQVAVNVSMTGPYTIHVISGNGESVWMRSGIVSGTKHVAINTSGMLPGVYHLVLTGGQGGRTVKKFVKE
jgi:uncharacterized delta-60 repeat protein